jgi:hypothetical protein
MKADLPEHCLLARHREDDKEDSGLVNGTAC